MLLRELFEDKSSTTVGIIFGRFNPPHQGHRAAWEMAAENDHWFVGTNQSTEGPKDPLPFKIKVEAMKKIFPQIKGNIVAETSWLTLASKVYKDYGNIILNVYTDEEWVTKTIMQYNGKEGPHGFYKFSNIQQQPTPRLSSATALRDAVIRGDKEAFSQAAGVDADTEVAGQPFFDLVAHYLLPYQNAPKKVAKKKEKITEKEDPKYIPVKTKTCPYCKRSQEKCLCSQREDAAGVGIITKQNSTVDVNKGTPRKNLKAFRLV
jgi:nicotinamide mononucleotide adenylyltransferase